MKAKLEVTKAEFQNVVNDLENKQTFASPSHLWKAVEETEWAKNHKPRPVRAPAGNNESPLIPTGDEHE